MGGSGLAMLGGRLYRPLGPATLNLPLSLLFVPTGTDATLPTSIYYRYNEYLISWLLAYRCPLPCTVDNHYKLNTFILLELFNNQTYVILPQAPVS